MKWMVAGYNYEEHEEITADLLVAIVEVALRHGFSVVQDQGIPAGCRDQYEKLVNDFGLKFIEVNIEADLSDIEQRFDLRMQAARERAKISVTDPQIMKQKYDECLATMNKSLPTFSSSRMTSEEIALSILSLIKSDGQK